MRRTLVLFLLLTACGGGSAGAPAAPDVPAILTITGPLDAAGGTPFTITGVALPGELTTRVTVRFTAAVGSPFDACRESSVTVEAIHTAANVVEGSSPAVVLTEDAPCFVTLIYAGPLEVASATPLVTMLGVPDVSVDQDLDGTPDRCDPNTYDFESDNLGQRPAEMTQLNGVNTGFEVATVDGEQVARYANGTSTGIHDRFDRFRQDVSHQDLTAYLDFDGTSTTSIEFWSEGSFSGSAGAGLLLHVRGGLLYLLQRIWRGGTWTTGPALPTSGRVRVRLRKEAGNTSTMYVDAWEFGAWTLDYAVFPIADDRPYRGLDTAMAEYLAGTGGIKRITLIREIPPAPLTIARTQGGTTDWKLFQRGPADTATLPVPVLYNAAEPVSLQARIVESATGTQLPGHGFTDHSLALPAASGARATLDLAGVPTGGNYDVEVRLVTAAGGAVLGTATLGDLAVGDVYLAIGQSNMSGYSRSLVGATTPIPEVHHYGNDGRWKQASEPMDDGTDQLDTVSREFPQHTLMLPFAKHLFENTGVPVAVIPAPLGGTNLYAQWQRNAADPDNRVTLYGSALHRVRVQRYAEPIRGILWYQGESDAIATRTTAQYRADLEQMVAQYRSDAGAPDAYFYCVQLGTWSAGGFPHWTNVQEAQRQVCAADARAALATVMDLARSDGIHYSVAAYQELGRRMADQARVLQFGHGLDPLTELVEAVAISGGTAIELRYDAPVAGGQASLFEVTDDTGTNAVTAVSAAGSTVTLQLTRALDTNALIRYGMSTGPAVAWIVDAAGVAVPAFADVPVP